MIEALLFDVFGTVVDWRTGIARQTAAFFADSGRTVDSFAFADAWRAKYQPAMEEKRGGSGEPRHQRDRAVGAGRDETTCLQCIQPDHRIRPRRQPLPGPVEGGAALRLDVAVQAEFRQGGVEVLTVEQSSGTYPGLPDHDHQPKVVGATPAHLVLIWIHRVFSNLKRWALGTFHGLRRAHLRRYLDEFVFRWNRRRHTATAFDTLLGIGARLRPADYRDIVGQRV